MLDIILSVVLCVCLIGAFVIEFCTLRILELHLMEHERKERKEDNKNG